MVKRFAVLFVCCVLVVLFCHSAGAQTVPAQQPLTPEERRARIAAGCDAMISTYMTLVMLESPRGQIEVERMLRNLSQSPFLALCYHFGWRYSGVGGLFPLPGLNATNPNPYPASAQSPGLGQAWQWTGNGLCKVEYEGYTQSDQAIDPAPPTEAQETLKAHWDESQKVYVFEVGCTKVTATTRSGRFNDKCEQHTAVVGAPAQPGCISKCRPDLKVPDGQLSMEADKATISWESEDPAPATPGALKFKTTCTFVR